MGLVSLGWLEKPRGWFWLVYALSMITSYWPQGGFSIHWTPRYCLYFYSGHRNKPSANNFRQCHLAVEQTHSKYMALTIKTEAMKPVGFVLLSCVLCLSVNSVIDGSTYANFKVHNRVFELYTSYNRMCEWYSITLVIGEMKFIKVLFATLCCLTVQTWHALGAGTDP